MPSFPTTGHEIARWLFALAVLFLLLKLAVCKPPKWRSTFSQQTISDAVLFATSSILLMGVWSPGTLRALGDLDAYLIFAGLGGIAASLRNIAGAEARAAERALRTGKADRAGGPEAEGMEDRPEEG